MCNNQAYHFYKRILQCQGSRDGVVVEHSPPTNVAQVRFPDSASYVGWIFWFSTLLREVFLRVLRFSPPLKPTYDLISVDLIWFLECIVKRIWSYANLRYRNIKHYIIIIIIIIINF